MAQSPRDALTWVKRQNRRPKTCRAVSGPTAATRFAADLTFDRPTEMLALPETSSAPRAVGRGTRLPWPSLIRRRS